MNEWMNNPLFENLDPVKRELIQMAAEKTAGKSGNAMATTMMSLVTSANKKGIRFTQIPFYFYFSHRSKCQVPQPF